MYLFIWLNLYQHDAGQPPAAAVLAAEPAPRLPAASSAAPAEPPAEPPVPAEPPAEHHDEPCYGAVEYVAAIEGAAGWNPLGPQSGPRIDNPNRLVLISKR